MLASRWRDGCMCALWILSSWVVCSTSAIGQYPLLPPETNGNANYQWRPELGGWLDIQNKLIWGYGITESLGYNTSYAGAQTVGSKYAAGLASQATWCLNQAQYCDSQALFYQTSDPVRSAAYANLAATYRASANAYQLASADAGQFTNWRSPTLAEFTTAWNRGLFSRGAGAFNMDMSPSQGYDAGYRNFNWTSNPLTGNKKNSTVFSLGSGTTMSVGVTSSLNAQMVRTYVP